MSFLSDLVNAYESGSNNKWAFELPKSYLDDMLKFVVCFEIKIEKIQAKFKLSQNRPQKDLPKIIKHLRQLNSDNSIEIADLIINNVQDK